MLCLVDNHTNDIQQGEDMVKAIRKNPASRNQRGAFTLIKLLIVISIIVLLAGILTPTISAIIKTAENTRAKTRIRALSDAAEVYQNDHDYYPGQLYPNMLGTSAYTGSQVLAACLFGYGYSNISDANPLANSDVSTYYADCKTADLIEISTRTNCISDRFSKNPLPILYYPARAGLAGLGQYAYGDNSNLTSDWNETSFNEFITDSRFGASTTPFNSGSFLLIAAGMDRDYGSETQKIRDNLRNW